MTFRQISAGNAHTCAIASNNKAYCWGTGSYGRLGYGSDTDTATPVAVLQGATPAATFLQISSGDLSTCTVATDNKGYCWGWGGSNTPQAISLGAMPASATIIKIQASYHHVCAIASDNKAYCWGSGAYGRLGNGSADDVGDPSAVSLGALPTGALLVDLAIGPDDSCAIASDNKAYCWGRGDSGGIGNGAWDDQLTPTAVSLGAMPSGALIAKISVGADGSCAIASDNQAYCWGGGSNGQLGNNATTTSQTPVAVAATSPQVNITQSVFRAYGPSATTTPGSPLAGDNTSAQLGAIAGDFRVRVGLSNTENARLSIDTMAAAGTSTCAVAADGWPYCWGAGSSGQLGNGASAAQVFPVPVSQGAIPAGTTLSQLTAGSQHICALGSNFKVYCWGAGSSGQLGNNASGVQSVPVAVSQGAMPTGATIRQISAGYSHTCAVASDNWAYCWGAGNGGQLGNGTTTASQLTPVAISQGTIPSGATIRQVTTGQYFSCALASDNWVYCWGNNANAQLGNGTATTSTPVAVSQGVIPSGASILQVVSGSQHSCAIASDNKAYCWGYGSSGQLGYGSTLQKNTPVAVSQGAMPTGATIMRITASNQGTCAVASDNQAYCWGAGGSGQLGNGTTTASQLTPVAVSQGAIASGATFRNIIAGSSGQHVCAITSDNQPYCWGTGNNGQMGDGTTTASRTTPVAVSQGVIPSGVTFSQVGAGFGYGCALGSDSWAYCWGIGTNGQLGNNATPSSQLIPVTVSQGAIPNGITLKQVTAGYSHVCALGSDNWAYCWGGGANGQLGNGTTTTTQSTPVAVSQGTIPNGVTLKQIAGGQYHTCALGSDNWAYCWGTATNGQLGNGTTNTTTPTAISQGAIPSGVTLRQISVGYSHTCAIGSNDKAYCWGAGSNGRLGNSASSDQVTPVAVSQGTIPAGVTIRQVSAGNLNTCAVASNDKAYCWGYGTSGQIGNGSTSTQTSPVAVSQGAIPGGATILQVAAGNTHACAIASNAMVYCWGLGTNGQLGNGTTTSAQSTPVAVSPGTIPAGVTIMQVAEGNTHTCALASDEQAYCWGNNTSGRLGNGTSASSQTTPTTVFARAFDNQPAIILPSQLALKLQVAPLGAAASCSLVSSGWTDVSTTSSLNWGSSAPTHGTAIGSFASDPSAPTSLGYKYQSIVQSGSFTNFTALWPQKTALWDAVLHDRSLSSATEYCLQMLPTTVSAAIDSYSQYPRIKTATGSLGLQFVDDSGATLSGSATDTAFTSLSSGVSVQQSLGQLIQSTGKKLEVGNSQTNSGWNVSLAATGGPTATWQSTGNSYPYNASTSAAGQLSVDTSGMTKTGFGNDPTGAACTTANLTNGTSGTFSNVVSSVTLVAGSPSAQFNCTWRLGSIGVSQTIPANQAGGSYSLDMTLTIVAN